MKLTFNFQLGGVVFDENGQDRSAELVRVKQNCAKKRKQQLAQSRSVEECRRPPEGGMKFAIGVVVKEKNWPPSFRVIDFWSLNDKKKIVGYSEKMCTRSRTPRLNRPFYRLMLDVDDMDPPLYFDEGKEYQIL